MSNTDRFLYHTDIGHAQTHSFPTQTQTYSLLTHIYCQTWTHSFSHRHFQTQTHSFSTDAFVNHTDIVQHTHFFPHRCCQTQIFSNTDTFISSRCIHFQQMHSFPREILLNTDALISNTDIVNHRHIHFPR